MLGAAEQQDVQAACEHVAGVGALGGLGREGHPQRQLLGVGAPDSEDGHVGDLPVVGLFGCWLEGGSSLACKEAGVGRSLAGGILSFGNSQAWSLVLKQCSIDGNKGPDEDLTIGFIRRIMPLFPSSGRRYSLPQVTLSLAPER